MSSLKKTILIMGTDYHAHAVYGSLVGMGEENVVMFNSCKEHYVQGDLESLSLVIDERRYNRDNVKSFYWRSYDGCLDGPNDEIVALNRRSIFESWLKSLSAGSARMFNDYQAWNLHRTKPWQNIIMNNFLKDGIISIPHINYGIIQMGCAIKGVQGGLHTVTDPSDARRDVPLASQRFVGGKTYRMFVFKDQCHSYELISDAVDYRSDDKTKSCKGFMEKVVVEAMQDLLIQLGWEWAGIDIIHDERNEWRLLDFNPSPMFIGFQSSENEVLKTLCKELINDCC